MCVFLKKNQIKFGLWNKKHLKFLAHLQQHTQQQFIRLSIAIIIWNLSKSQYNGGCFSTTRFFYPITSLQEAMHCLLF